jgi:hypothetical protein
VYQQYGLNRGSAFLGPHRQIASEERVFFCDRWNRSTATTGMLAIAGRPILAVPFPATHEQPARAAVGNVDERQYNFGGTINPSSYPAHSSGPMPMSRETSRPPSAPKNAAGLRGDGRK